MILHIKDGYCDLTKHILSYNYAKLLPRIILLGANLVGMLQTPPDA